MGTASSVLTCPPDREEVLPPGLTPSPPAARPNTVVLNCYDQMPTYYMVTPAVTSVEECERLGDKVCYMSLVSNAQTFDVFNQHRFRAAGGTFSVLDPNGRFYPLRNVTEPVQVYYCVGMSGPPTADTDHPYSVVVVPAPQKDSSPARDTIGDFFFGRILGLARPPPRPEKWIKILTLDEAGREKVVTLSGYNFEINLV